MERQEQALSYLTSVGLSDAVLWLNNYYQLSDSQRARFEIAEKMMNDNIICVDEFLSTLDRKTAQTVAFSIQRAVRRSGKQLIVTTAHDDLLDYLMPDLLIQGEAFPSRWKVLRLEVTDDNPITKNVKIRCGTKDEYREERLGELHYKGKYTGGTKEFLFAEYDNQIIGVLVAIYNMHTDGRRISRLVVHPTYRGCGVAQMLVRAYLKDFPNTDVVAAMAMFNPVFERAGMKRVDDVVITSPKGLKDGALALGFDDTKWHDKQYLREFCQSKEVRDFIGKYANKASNLVCPAGEYLEEEKIREKIINEPQTAARVLFGLRPRIMAKYENKESENNGT